jgi:GNAT superfamily N-acetyltransferase
MSSVDEMAGDFTPLPEPYDPLDVDVNPLEVLNIKDPVKNIDGNPITDERHLKYLTDIPGQIRQVEKRLANLEKAGPSLFIGDDENNAKLISELKKTLQLSRSNLAQYWLAIPENIRKSSKPKNTSEAVMARVTTDESRTVDSIPASANYKPSSIPTDRVKRAAIRYSTKNYTDQYGREYLIGTLVSTAETDGDTFVLDSTPISYTFSVDKNSPEFEAISSKWSETIEAADKGEYDLSIGLSAGKSGYLTADEETIGMVETKPLYMRRGLATAMLEIARESQGEGFTINHSSNISNPAQVWSDVVDADAPELRSEVPAHNFEQIDEMSGDTNYLPEPYNPLDPSINPIEVLGIGAVLEGKGLDGRMLRQNDWLNDAIPQVKSKEELLSKMKSDLSKNPDDEDLKDAIGSVDLDLKILRDNIARVYLALEQNVRVTSKPKNTRDAVMARVTSDNSRTVDSLPPIPESVFSEAGSLTTLPLRYSTKEYTDQYGRKYLIGTIVAKDAVDRDQFEERSRYPHSFVFALDMQHPLFERANRQWNETMEAANNGEYDVSIFSGTVGSLSVQNQSISLISIEPLYQRRGLGTALLEIARENYADFDGTDYEINHSSTISHPARAWSDIVDADAPDLRDKVPAHRFESVDEMAGDWSPIEGLTSGKGTSETLDRAITGDYLDLKKMELATEVPMTDVDMLSDEDIDALLWYTTGSYRQINAIMRGFEDPEMFEDKRNRLLKVIDRLTKAIDENGDVTEPYRVFRGESRGGKFDIDKAMDDLQPGDVVEDSAFTSTSAYPYPAFSGFGPGFSNPRNRNNAAAPGSNGAAFWAIDIPAGAKAMRVPNVTSNTHEAEVILPPDTKFRIKAIRKVPQVESVYGNLEENGRFNYYIEAEVLNVAKDWTPTEGVGPGLGVEKSPK